VIGARRGLGGPGGLNPLLLIGLVLLAYAYISGTLFAPVQDPIQFLAFVIAIVLGITVHEFMHAYAAHRLGDDTGRMLGRMSLNPMAHLDPWGTLLLVLAGFGYGKPVPFNESRLRSSAAVTLVALAGPAANLALAALFAIPLRAGTADVFGDIYTTILVYVVRMNCILAIFNLVPIPPLDGANVVYGLLPPRQQYSWRTFQQYGPFLLLFVFLFAPRILNAIVFAPAIAIARALIGF
jgi:Zn-dependent protease